MRKIFFNLIFIFSISSINAQWECRSKLASSLRPIGSTNFSWGNEFTTSSGYLTDNFIHNSMAFGGIDYSNKKSNFFVEGGYKVWYRTEYDVKINKDTVDFTSYTGRFGLREAMYQYSGDQSKLIVGLHSARLKDHFLLNERIVGLAYNHDLGKFNLAITGGSVSRDFARNGSFCSVRYLYDIIKNRKVPPLGNALGKTNLVATTLVYYPHKMISKTPASADEFSTVDEFSSEIAENKKSSILSVESLGSVAYREYFDMLDSIHVDMYGVFSTINFWGGINFEPEVLFQNSLNNKAIVYSLGLNKSFLFSNNHKLNLAANYMGLYSIDSMAMPMNSFSNLLVGEVVRLDAIDMPMHQISLKYAIPSIKAHFKIQSIANYLNETSRDLYRTSFKEIDIEIGKTFFGKLLINAQFGMIEFERSQLTEKKNLARAEIRYIF